MTLHEAKIPSAIVTVFIAVVMWLIDYYSEIGWIAADGLLWLFLIFLGAGGLLGLVGLGQFYRGSTSIDPHKPEKADALATTASIVFLEIPCMWDFYSYQPVMDFTLETC